MASVRSMICQFSTFRVFHAYRAAKIRTRISSAIRPRTVYFT